MSKNKDTKTTDSLQRTSHFDKNRPCYLSADGKTYCYERLDPNTQAYVIDRYEVGKGEYTTEWTIVLDEEDHAEGLNNRYEGELRDSLFDAKVASHTADDDEDSVDPWESLADNTGNPETILFGDAAVENPDAQVVRRVIEEECTPEQQDFYYRHFGMGMTLEQMRQEEAARTGNLPSSQAMTNRKNKIIAKVAKALGVTPVKRHSVKKG